MSSLTIGRLALGPPLQWWPQVGDAVGNVGGAIVPGVRNPPQYQLVIGTIAADGQTDTVAQRIVYRNQLLSMLNNTPLKQQAYLYLVYSDDSAQSGWFVPDQAQLEDFSQAVGLATGFWELSGNWLLGGRRRLNREGRSIWMKDLRTGSYRRDFLGWIYSTDFTALPALQVSVFPNGASSVQNAVSGQALACTALPTGRDGGVCQQFGAVSPNGLADLSAVSYERTEAQLNLSDVIVYDRMGAGDAPAGGPGATWNEVYGPDWPYNWLAATPVADAPVLDNGLVRVRYDGANTPGFRVDVWNGSAYVEQGKMIVERIGDSTGYCNTWVAASLCEWTPDRAVVQVVLANSADLYSRERVFITVQRGELSVAFECYPALKAAGTLADAVLQWTPALNAGAADLNNGVAKIDSQGSGSWAPGGAGNGEYAATAGTGAGTGNSGVFPAGPTTLGNANFTTSENWVSILRCPTTYNVPAAYQQTLVMLQAANAILKYGSSSTAYGTTQNTYQVSSQNAAGYIQCQVAFGATVAQQVLEGESMTLGTNWSSVADANASGGNAAKTTQTSDVGAISQATWPNGFLGTYRIFVRAQATINSTVYVTTTGQATPTGDPVTITGQATPTYSWYDLGELVANNVTLSLHGWCNTAGRLQIDRIEAHLVQDRARTGAIYAGARDSGQSALYDARQLGCLVAR